MSPTSQSAPSLTRTPWAMRWLAEQTLRPGRGAVTHTPHHDRRRHPRWPLSCPLYLIDLEARSVVRCHTEDLSAGGARVQVPTHVRLRLHQLCQFRLMLHHHDRPNVLEHLEGQACLVRSDWSLAESGPCRTVGLRFESQDVVAFLKSWPTASGYVFQVPGKACLKE